MKLLSAILITLISLTSAHAEEGIIKKPQQYDIEFIIFEDAHARYINSEDWTQESVTDEPIIETSKSQSQTDNTDTGEINTVIFKDTKPVILTKEYKRMNSSKEYNVLFYGSWRQDGLEKNKAFDINIDDLKNNHKSSSGNSITGTVKLVLARFLHFYTDMEYKRETTDNTQTETNADNATQVETTYPIKMHRRMRSKELHYIDHPLLGMLIQINPVKAVIEETAEKPAKLSIKSSKSKTEGH